MNYGCSCCFESVSTYAHLRLVRSRKLFNITRAHRCVFTFSFTNIVITKKAIGETSARAMFLQFMHLWLILHLDITLKRDDHDKHLASSCYGVLAALRKIKNLTNYHHRKYLVECLVVSHLDFNDIIFHPITDCLLKRLQHIQFAAASFVFGRYVNNIDSILKLGWLPMKERREWHVLKAAHKAIYSHDWPRNLQLERVKHAKNLRSLGTINLVISYASDTFQYSAASLFNSLPSNVKCWEANIIYFEGGLPE